MDNMHRNQDRVGKTRLDGKGEKKRPQTSENAEHAAPKRPRVSSYNINTQNQSRAPQADARVQAEATRHVSPQRDTSQNEANEGYIPMPRPHLAAFSLLRILPAVEVHTNKALLIKNPRPDGPPTDICARIPGSENNWAARVSCYDSMCDFRDWILRNSREEHPEIWMYISTSQHGECIDFYGTWDYLLFEPLSIVVISNPRHPLPSNWFKPPSGYTSACPLKSQLRGVLGPEGSKWLV